MIFWSSWWSTELKRQCNNSRHLHFRRNYVLQRYRHHRTHTNHVRRSNSYTRSFSLAFLWTIIFTLLGSRINQGFTLIILWASSLSIPLMYGATQIVWPLFCVYLGLCRCLQCPRTRTASRLVLLYFLRSLLYVSTYCFVSPNTLIMENRFSFHRLLFLSG